MDNKTEKRLNGIDVEGLQEFRKDISNHSDHAMIDYKVNLEWLGGTKSRVTTKEIILGGERHSRNFSFIVDEPEQLLGQNTHPTPQEYLLGGMGACMLVGFSVGAAVEGIELEKLEIEITSGLDLRGFLEVDPDAPISLKDVKYTIKVKGNGTKDQFEKIHQTVIKTSPNRATVANSINIIPELVIEE